MNTPEYDGETDPDTLSPTAEVTEPTATGGDPAGGDVDDQSAWARERQKAIEDEAIEGEHLDYFLEHVSDTER